MNILVIRFRQMGDAILATVVLNTLRKTFPDACIDFVLNKRLCPLFEGHPSIDHTIPFTEEERHNIGTYLRMVWQIVHKRHYDIIIDLRSTMNTLPFSLFSPFTKYRIGLKKPYTRLAFNCSMDCCGKDESVVDHDLSMLKPLEKEWDIQYTRDFTLSVTDKELQDYREYLLSEGVDFSKPVILCGVTTKLAEKRFSMDKMLWLVRKTLEAQPLAQLIFNYAPGHEHDDAFNLWHQLGENPRVLINVVAKSPRELVALASLSTVYVGNEGGARHIVQAVGTPSFAICAPQINIKNWIPHNDVPAMGVYGGDESKENIWKALKPWLSRYCVVE